MTGSVYPSKDFVALADKVVGIAQHSGNEHGDEEVVVDGVKQRLCNELLSISCKTHEGMRSDLAKHDIGKNVAAVPTHIILTPDGKEVFRYSGAMGVKQIKDRIEDASKSLGKGISHAACVKVRDGLSNAEKQLKDGQVRAALESLKWVDGAKAQTPSVERARQLLEEIDAKGAEVLASAKALADTGQAAEAEKVLAALAKDYAGRPVEKEAKKALQGLKASKS